MESRILHLFGGKGGVGKTTLAQAFALHLSEHLPEQKVLLVALDSSGAQSDLLKKKLGAAPVRVVSRKGQGGLFAAELDRAALREGFLARYKPALEEAFGKGAVLTEEDGRRLVGYLAAELQELAGFLQVSDWLEEKAFDRIVLDLPPTSELVRLLDTPNAARRLLALSRGADKLKARKPGAPVGPLDELSVKVDQLSALIRNPAITAFHLVALAEPVVEAQTRFLFSQLKERGVPIAEIVVNEIEDGSGCPACQGRRGLQAPNVRKFQQLDKSVPVHLVARREVGPKGPESLAKVASDWLTGNDTKTLEFAISEGPPALVRAPSMAPIAAPPLPPTRLIFFVGQGGVGKSSCAAAAAVTLTEKEGPVLLISADPAHSLSDVLQSRLTDTETQVKGTKGLYARELDTPAWLGTLRKRFKELAERIEANGKGEFALDREMVKNPLEWAPAGINELAALSTLTDALVQERFKRIVVDLSPASGTVRLLDFPEVARAWLTSLLGVLVKYRAKGTGPLADEISAILKHVKRFEEALSTANEARFVVVTQGEELALPKTERLVEFLKSRRLAVERVLVNRVLPKSTCAKCENRRKLELLAARNVEKKLGLPVTVAPALGRHPAGLRELKAFRTSWYALSAPAKIKAA